MLTSQRPYAGAFNYKLNMVFIKNEIRVRVMAQVMTLGQQIAWADWSYAKAKGNLFNDAFMKFHPDIVEMTSKLAGGKIRYYKE